MTRNTNFIKYRDYKWFDHEMFIKNIVRSSDVTAQQYANIDVQCALMNWENNCTHLCDKHAPFCEIHEYTGYV